MKLKVGDKIVEFGQVFRVFKVETKKNSEGETQRIIHFRPFYKSDENKGMICSIPEDSIEHTNIRRPIDVETAKDLVKKLADKPKSDVVTDIDSVKQILGTNDPHETVKVVRSLWIEKITAESFTKSKSDVFELAKSRLVEEVAYATNSTPDKAHSKLKNTLEKAHK